VKNPLSLFFLQPFEPGSDNPLLNLGEPAVPEAMKID
jgi:hypothetical protein